MKKRTSEKTNEETKAEVTKPRKQRAPKLFFLYAMGKGFLAYDETGWPTFDCNKELARFNTKREALFAASMCKKFKLADSIDIMTKVG